MALQVYTKDIVNAVVLVPKWKIPFLWAYNKLWNLLRKPAVKLWQSEVLKIASDLKASMASELLPVLYDYMREGCTTCRDSYGYLRGEVFVSNIKLVLEKGRCQDHSKDYLAFLINHEDEFRRSKELSDKICGFTSNEK